MKKLAYILILSSLITSCEDKIDLTVPEGPEKLVVDGILMLSEEDSVQSIILSRTSAYFESSPTPRVSGAKVFVTSNKNDTINYKENAIEPGLYESNYKLDDTTLSFVLHIVIGAKKYISYEEFINRVPTIDSLRQSDELLPAAGDFRKEGYSGLLTTKEPKGIGDFYRWIIYINDEKKIDPFSLIITDDRLVDGNLIKDWDIINELQPGDNVVVFQMSISERAYHYWSLIFDQITNFGGPFTTPPAPVEGNMRCTTDSKEKVLGFFGVSRVSKAKLKVVAK